MAKQHRVSAGDTLSSLAKQYGFANWRTIYHHPQNATLRQKRPNPHLLCPGDSVFIPDNALKDEPGVTEARHTFKKTAEPLLLRLKMKDINGNPFTGARYEYTVGGHTFEAFTGADGLIEHEIPRDAHSATLTVWLAGEVAQEVYTWTLKIGHLTPVEDLAGVQARLNNLGFYCGPVDGTNGPKTRAGVRAFQEHYGLTVDAIPGPKTQTKLKEVYGC